MKSIAPPFGFNRPHDRSGNARLLLSFAFGKGGAHLGLALLLFKVAFDVFPNWLETLRHAQAGAFIQLLVLACAAVVAGGLVYCGCVVRKLVAAMPLRLSMAVEICFSPADQTAHSAGIRPSAGRFWQRQAAPAPCVREAPRWMVG